ncbi:MAG: hypothetical protein MZV64_00460 [Ignavibacteriales bacterium]|nr:hypothetical protein [Ignavibacteriales bacterium]
MDPQGYESQVKRLEEVRKHARQRTGRAGARPPAHRPARGRRTQCRTSWKLCAPMRPWARSSG